MSDQDFDWTLIKKTRKERVGWGCQDRFPPGSTIWKAPRVFDGRFTEDYYCPPCFKILGSISNDDIEYVNPGDLKNWNHRTGEGEKDV
jgi:hypothetical protein